MQRYNSVQTGPKTQSGGVQAGLASPAYHSARLGRVARPPIPAAPKQISAQTTSPTALTCHRDPGIG